MVVEAGGLGGCDGSGGKVEVVDAYDRKEVPAGMRRLDMPRRVSRDRDNIVRGVDWMLGRSRSS